jgi:DNA polymerase
MVAVISEPTTEQWEALRAAASACTRCDLAQTRTQVVFGSGNQTAKVVVVGEAPGAKEDASGQPFVGPSGSLLIKLLTEETGITRDDVMIINAVKCRPPANRNPTKAELAACAPWLDQQLAILAPTVVVPVGNFATKRILGGTEGISKVRGKVYPGSAATGVTLTDDTTVVPTFHPAAALQGGGARVIDAMKHDLGFVREILAGHFNKANKG